MIFQFSSCWFRCRFRCPRLLHCRPFQLSSLLSTLFFLFFFFYYFFIEIFRVDVPIAFSEIDGSQANCYIHRWCNYFYHFEIFQTIFFGFPPNICVIFLSDINVTHSNDPFVKLEISVSIKFHKKNQSSLSSLFFERLFSIGCDCECYYFPIPVCN